MIELGIQLENVKLLTHQNLLNARKYIKALVSFWQDWLYLSLGNNLFHTYLLRPYSFLGTRRERCKIGTQKSGNSLWQLWFRVSMSWTNETAHYLVGTRVSEHRALPWYECLKGFLKYPFSKIHWPIKVRSKMVWDHWGTYGPWCSLHSICIIVRWSFFSRTKKKNQIQKISVQFSVLSV